MPDTNDAVSMTRGASDWLSRLEGKVDRLIQDVADLKASTQVHAAQITDAMEVVQGHIADHEKRLTVVETDVTVLKRHDATGIWLARGTFVGIWAVILALHDHVIEWFLNLFRR